MSSVYVDPVCVCLQLSPTFIPGLNKASELLRAAYPKASDAELLERILINGISATINRYEKVAKA